MLLRGKEVLVWRGDLLLLHFYLSPDVVMGDGVVYGESIVLVDLVN